LGENLQVEQQCEKWIAIAAIMNLVYMVPSHQWTISQNIPCLCQQKLNKIIIMGKVITII